MKGLISSAYVDDFMQNGKLTSIKVIDTHTHMGDIYGASEPIDGIDECLALLDDENVESIWCAPHSDLFYMGSVNPEITRIMAKYPSRVKGYFGFNPNYYKEYIDKIGEVLTNTGYIGLKFLPAYHNYSLCGDAYTEALEFADAHSLVVLSHTWGRVALNSPKEVREILKRYHNIQFIMGHSAPGELDESIAIAKQFDNAYLDICDIHRNGGTVEKMVKAAGSEKVLFGTDLPWYDPNYAIGSVLFAKITDRDRANIFRNNAVRMLGEIRR